MPLWKAIKVTNGCDFTSMESQRGGFWEQTWGCVYLCPLWEPPGFKGVREERGRGITGWTMFTRPLHSFSCATLGLFCSPEATAKLIKKRQVRPPWDNNTNPLLPTPAPLYPQTLGNKDEGRRGAIEEECMLQWLLHSGAVAPRCVKAAECFQFLSTLSPRRVRVNRTNERRRVTGCERRPEKREKGNNRVQGTKWERTFRKFTLTEFALWELRRLRRLNGAL